MKSFRAAQVVRKRMHTDRKEVEALAYLHEPSRQIDILRKGRIVAAYKPDKEAIKALIPPDAKLPRGRPKYWLTLAPELGYLVGVDFAHQAASVSITRANFDPLLDEVRKVPIAELDDDPVCALDAAAKLIRDVIVEVRDREKLAPEQVIGIGVGLPGPVDRVTKTITPKMQILSAWSDFNPVAELSARLSDLVPNVPIEVDNDASLGALGVYSWKTLIHSWKPDAAGKSRRVHRDLLYVRVSDGIGAGVVIKGKLVGGGSGFAGEIGHVKIDDRGTFCPRCGQRGCVETMASERALLTDLGTTVFASEDEELSIEAVLASEHPATFRALQEAGWHLGTALAHARTLLDPTRIYIGGPMGRSEDFLQGVRDGIVRNSLDLESNIEEIVVPSPRELPVLRPDLGSAELLGALAMALHRCGDLYIQEQLRRYIGEKKPLPEELVGGS